MQTVTGAVTEASETSAVRPAREQILVPAFQTSVFLVLEKAHYILAAENIFFKKKKNRKHPIQRGPGPAVISALSQSPDTPSVPSRGRDGGFFLRWFTWCDGCCFVGFRLMPTTQSSKPHHSSTIQLVFSRRPPPPPPGHLAPVRSREEIRFFLLFLFSGTLLSHISDSRLRHRGSSSTVAWVCSLSEMLSV